MSEDAAQFPTLACPQAADCTHIAQGLAFLHPTIIHRDLKPGLQCGSIPGWLLAAGNVLLLRDPAAAALLPGPGTHTSSLDGSERRPAPPATQQQHQHAGVASGSANNLQGSCSCQADGAAEQEASLLQLRVKLSDFGLARMRAGGQADLRPSRQSKAGSSQRLV
ncbi:hypothetical protein HaLaN_07186 [Haematococcus lacustris]|uniref:Protein kinase domain-containing protein n=1 Tax=Haematococcus lacustris TaxID=44745 RepID=A0A699YNF8_HAELA|nr:hypothetical protein HaLaN_07186 [Haematococcus lacustris]